MSLDENGEVARTADSAMKPDDAAGNRPHHLAWLGGKLDPTIT